MPESFTPQEIEEMIGATTRSYLIPITDLTLDERRQIRQVVDRQILLTALRLRIKDDPHALLIRDTLPVSDLGMAVTEDWLVPGAGVAGTELQYMSAALANDRCVAFFGLASESATNDISRVRFTQGATSAQIRGVFQIEQLNTCIEPRGYFSEPVLFQRIETVRIMVMPRTAFGANFERLTLFGRTCEPIGNTLSAPSS